VCVCAHARGSAHGSDVCDSTNYSLMKNLVLKDISLSKIHAVIKIFPIQNGKIHKMHVLEFHITPHTNLMIPDQFLVSRRYKSKYNKDTMLLLSCLLGTGRVLDPANCQSAGHDFRGMLQKKNKR
jgi:hypothetical protein